MTQTKPAQELPPFLTVEGFAAPGNGVDYGFFGREGGVSAGGFATLNTSFAGGDARKDVLENRARVAAAFALPPERLALIQQTHSNICHIVDKDAAPFFPDGTEGDALATDRPGVIVAVQTADCVPALFHGRTADGRPVVAAAHAGWKGALSGILENTVAAMVRLGAVREDIHACIGPCIGAASYEVSAGFEKPFLEESPDAADFFGPAAKDGKLMFDVGGYAAWRLTRTGPFAGLVHVYLAGKDTCALEARYFSHRRATIQGRRDDGRQISAIAIRGGAKNG